MVIAPNGKAIARRVPKKFASPQNETALPTKCRQGHLEWLTARCVWATAGASITKNRRFRYQ
jgi:hypothetical protein